MPVLSSWVFVSEVRVFLNCPSMVFFVQEGSGLFGSDKCSKLIFRVSAIVLRVKDQTGDFFFQLFRSFRQHSYETTKVQFFCLIFRQKLYGPLELFFSSLCTGLNHTFKYAGTLDLLLFPNLLTDNGSCTSRSTAFAIDQEATLPDCVTMATVSPMHSGLCLGQPFQKSARLSFGVFFE